MRQRRAQLTKKGGYDTQGAVGFQVDTSAIAKLKQDELELTRKASLMWLEAI